MPIRESRRPIPIDPGMYDYGVPVDAHTVEPQYNVAEYVEIPYNPNTILWDGTTDAPTQPEHQLISYSQEQYRRYMEHTRQTLRELTDNPLYGYEQTMQRYATTMGDTKLEAKKEVNLMPKKINKLKEWSISARALRNVITYAIYADETRYDYKFGSVWDRKYKLFRVWNVKTQNVVCTIKKKDNTVIIRFRENSYYRTMLSSLAGMANPCKYKVISIPSDKLCLHRGNSSTALRNLSDSQDAQLGFRKKCYEFHKNIREDKSRWTN